MRRNILLLLCMLLFMTACQKEEPEDTALLTLDGEAIDIREGTLYLELTRRAYEENGGQEVWEFSLAGRDPAQTAADKALESLIRTKILCRQIASSELTEEDRKQVTKSTQALMEELGTEMMEEIGLSEEELYVCMEESYRAWKYKESMVFLPGTQEDELEYQIAEAFVKYDTVDQPSYLQRVELDAVMVYNGEWVHDNWIEYPESQKKEQRLKIEEALNALEEGTAFEQVRQVYSEDASLKENRLLHEGIVQADTKGTPVLYRGQIQTDLAEAIFRTPVGEYTGILETRYGYIIVYVKSYAEVEAADYEVYRLQLAKAREEYRISLMQELSEEQFQEEYERLKTEVEVIVNEELWETVS